MQYLFVYGTLRPGGSNHGLLQGATIAENDAVAEGMALYSNAANTYPYAAPRPGQRVIGTLCTVLDQTWPALRFRLDLLEGYDPRHPDTSHYRRQRWTVTTGNGARTEAWVYLAGSTTCLRADRLIDSGDWLRGIHTDA